MSAIAKTTQRKAMITSLTEEQLALFPEYVRRWTDIGLDCSDMDVISATDAVDRAYAFADLAPPHIIVADSPLSGVIIASLLKGKGVRDSVGASVGARVRASVSASVWDSVGDSVGASVRASVGARVRASVGARVRASVSASVGARVGDSVGASVGARVRDSVWDSVGDSVGARVGDMLYASHDAGFVSYTSFFHEQFPGQIPNPERWECLRDLCHHIGWWATYRGVAIIQRKHSELNRNDEGQLHNDSGMAFRYRDGWGDWYLNGIRVDEQIVMRPESQTLEQINSEQNSDVKSVRIERFGWVRYLKESSAEVVDSRHNEIENTYEALCRLPDGVTRLVVTCPTKRIFALGVPSDVQTCEQAQRWLAGDKPFRVLART